MWQLRGERAAAESALKQVFFTPPSDASRNRMLKVSARKGNSLIAQLVLEAFALF